MATIALEGETLGQKHRCYNNLVKTAVSAAELSSKPSSIDYEKPDLENLLKIDVACRNKDISFILEVLKCEDMLYASRAIKKSKWLITEDEYACIINPEYLQKSLFPYMMTKAKNKLLLSIRLNLRDEPRVEAFFNFFINDFKTAQKWLPYCSLSFIEDIVRNNAKNITASILKRLCEKSFRVLKVYSDNCFSSRKRDVLKHTLFLLNTNIEEYLDVIESIDDYMKPIFEKTATRLMMKQCPERIIKNFELYCPYIDEATMAKYMKKDEIREFLMKLKLNSKFKNWFKYENISHYVKYMPEEEKYEFIMKVFIDKEDMLEIVDPESDWGLTSPTERSLQCYVGTDSWFSKNNAYYLRYQFAPFEIAFIELKKQMYTESPVERNAILTVLIYCTRRNPQHVHSLLQFYREKHINEPFKYKEEFVNTLVTFIKTHKFDETTWNILNDIFSSMEVYMETGNFVTICIHSIIVYKVLHDQNVPEIIEKKFQFNPLKEWRVKLDEDEKEKIFNYLYNFAISKLPKAICNEFNLATTVSYIEKILILLKEWNRNITDHKIIIDKIKEVIQIKKKNSFRTYLSPLFHVRKQWRRHMFEESLILYPSDYACVNALKHDPELLSRCHCDVEAIFSDDSITLRQTLQKLRVFWTNTLAQKWTDTYLERLKQSRGHKSLIEGISILLPREQFILLLQKHAPITTKIDRSDIDANTFSLRTNIARYMKFVRPSLNIDAVLLYAKEDYLQYTLPSLSAILYNVSPIQSIDCIIKLLNSPVPLQKLGIRLAFSKLNIEKIKELLYNVWKNTKDSSIRTILFTQTYELLCKENNPSAITKNWEMLSMFIQHLATEENKRIYNKLGSVAKVPLLVKGQYFMESYKYLQSLPANNNCRGILRSLDDQAADIIHLLEASFIEDVLLKTTADHMVKRGNYSHVSTHLYVLSLHIFCSDTEDIQNARFQKVLVPIILRCLASWQKCDKGEYFVRKNFKILLDRFAQDLKTYILDKNYFTPVKLFKDIQKTIVDALPVEENYDILMMWNFVVLFAETLQTYLLNNPAIIEVTETAEQEENAESPSTVANYEKKVDVIWKKLITDIAPSYGAACLIFLKKDILTVYSSLYIFVAKALWDVFALFDYNDLNRCQTMKAMLSDIDATASFLVVIDMIRYMPYKIMEAKPVLREIKLILQSHTSKEVKMHYCDYDNNQYHSDPESEDEV